jgi:hypothetical protein
MKQLKLMQTLLKQMQGCRCNAFEEYGKKLLSKKLERNAFTRASVGLAPYKFLSTHAPTRSTAFSMFSIELATLNRR